jgi:hypothetical protein
MKNIDVIHELLKNNDITEKIQLVFGVPYKDSDYDNYENNEKYTNLAPITIRGIVRQISSESLVWRTYGLAETGSIEIITEKKYKEWFKNCRQIIYDGNKYEVFKEATGGRVLIESRPNNVIRIILRKRT